MDALQAPYANLTPDLVLDALESVGLSGDGRLLALNSYENRVYRAQLDTGGAVVAKFYRPGRWSDIQILEEHAFAAELVAAEVPVIAPLAITLPAMSGATLAHHAGYAFAVYPNRGGRAPELDRPGTLEWIGRFLGRIHAIGATHAFTTRPALDIASFGEEPRAFLLASGMVPGDLLPAYRAALDLALAAIERAFGTAGAVTMLRLHGDCHAGNILWTDAGPHFVDLDDARMGPAVQDLWMLLAGDRSEMSGGLQALLGGYRQFHTFDRRELGLIEPLRTLRLIHYAAWLARRWDDPAFPAAFPWFNTQRYWQDRILELREQIAAMDEPALVIDD